MGQHRPLPTLGASAESPYRDRLETAVLGQEPAQGPAGEVSERSHIGRHVVLEEIGRGGMGRVVRAYDSTLRREVAIKEVLRQALGHDGATRIIVEARAMARLSHPHVVAVYDVEETTADCIALVMEFVRGRTLQSWLEAQPQTPAQILTRFIAAGRGLAAAHRAGLLHRDFKPANVLLGDEGSIKVTDFGLAKMPSHNGDGSGERAAECFHPGSGAAASFHADLTPDPELTQAGVVLGTPRYMAPEQHCGEPLTPAIDQFAFCVALWEALCGKPPFRGETLVRQKHRGPPPWKGTGVRRGVVDALVRGLSPAPEDRWPTMDALLGELTRVAGGYGRRRRWSIAAAVGLLGVVLHPWAMARVERCSGAKAQLAGVWDGARQEQVREAVLGTSLAYAPQVWTRLEGALADYSDRWVAHHTDACEATTLRQEQSSALMDLRMACLQRAKVRFGAVVDVLATADADVVARAHDLVDTLAPLERCADAQILDQEGAQPLPREEVAVAEIRGWVAQAEALAKAGRYEQARSELDRAQAQVAGIDFVPVKIEVALQQAEVLGRLADFSGAQGAARAALRLAAHSHQAAALGRAASWLMYQVGYAEQRQAEGLAYRDIGQAMTTDPASSNLFYSHLSLVYAAAGNLEAAEEAIGQVLAPQGDAEAAQVSPGVHNNLAMILYNQGNFREAESHLRQALDAAQAQLGGDHPLVGMFHNNLSLTLWSRGMLAEAEAQQRRALTIREAAFTGAHPDVASSHSNLGGILLARQQGQAAEAEFRSALAMLIATMGADHPTVASVRSNLAEALNDQKRFVEAEVQARTAVALGRRSVGQAHPQLAIFYSSLGGALAGQGRDMEAKDAFATGLALWRDAGLQAHAHAVSVTMELADVLLRLPEHEQALRLAEDAWERSQEGEVAPFQRAEAAYLLARALWASGGAQGRSRARELGRQAVVILERDSGDAGPRLEHMRTWLRAHDRGYK